MRAGARLLLAVAGVMLAGCVSTGPDNPRFLISNKDVYEDRRRMQREAVQLDRPVVVIGGYRGPSPIARLTAHKLERMTSTREDDFLDISIWFVDDSAEMVNKVVDEVAAAFGTNEDETETIEVDVVGISTGGLVARAAAIAEEGRPTLRIRRLFTIATPHRGADLAERVAPDDAARDLRSGSEYLDRLNEVYAAGVDYELIPYGVIGDGVVGVVNSAPPGELPIWTRGKIFGSHLTAQDNERILADIARRLRGEEPISDRGEPLPTFQ